MKKAFLFYTVFFELVFVKTGAGMENASILALAHSALTNLNIFTTRGVGGWQETGILGRYNIEDKARVDIERLNRDNVESMLGYCRAYFVGSHYETAEYWKQIPELKHENITKGALKKYHEKVCINMMREYGGTAYQANVFAFITSTDVSVAESRRIFNDFLGNTDHVISNGLTHKYTLEDAYIILHMHPRVHWWSSYTSKDHEVYVNLIAMALKTLVNGGEFQMTISQNFDRTAVLESVVKDYFSRFILSKPKTD